MKEGDITCETTLAVHSFDKSTNHTHFCGVGALSSLLPAATCALVIMMFLAGLVYVTCLLFSPLPLPSVVNLSNSCAERGSV